MRLNVYFSSKNAWLLDNALFVFLHFLRFWGLFSFKKTHTFFSLEFLVKNDLSYLSGICFGHYYIYIYLQMTIQFKLSASALFSSLVPLLLQSASLYIMLVDKL